MRIVKRKKGNDEYFYLQFSFRKGTKVITKEKYLGKEIPRDIEKIRENIKKEFKKELYAKLEKIRENFQVEWQKYPESIKEKLKEDISIAFTYNTNAIEGSTITLEDAREIIHDKISPNKPLRDVKETESHSRVFLELLDKNEKISSKLILNWHKEIFKDTKPDIAGEYRTYLVSIADHLAPDWQEIRKLISSLIRFINNKKDKINPVELSAIAHYRFEKIHPFGDGNGRIGRLITNYLLWHSSYPMLIIEYKKRRSYYRALRKSEEYFTNYFLRRYLAVNRKRLS
jgi:Fic family protein